MVRLMGRYFDGKPEGSLGVCENCGRPKGIRERHIDADEALCPTCASEARAWMLQEDESRQRPRGDSEHG